MESQFSKKNKIILSIIIPIYNVEEYIEECLNSILNQVTDEVEIIVINDGTKDSSFQLCNKTIKNYHVDNLIVLDKENTGLSHTRNVGIKSSVGKYIMFLDSDDSIMENSICKLLERLKCKDFDAIVFGYMISNGYNNRIVDSKLDLCNLDTTSILNSISNPLSNVWRYVVKRDVVFSKGLFFRENCLCEDIEWCTKFICSNLKIGYLDTCIYIYRKNRSTSIMNNHTYRRLYDTFENIYISKCFVDECSMPIKLKSTVYLKLMNQYIYNLSFIPLIVCDDNLIEIAKMSSQLFESIENTILRNILGKMELINIALLLYYMKRFKNYVKFKK